MTRLTPPPLDVPDGPLRADRPRVRERAQDAHLAGDAVLVAAAPGTAAPSRRRRRSRTAARQRNRNAGAPPKRAGFSGDISSARAVEVVGRVELDLGVQRRSSRRGSAASAASHAASERRPCRGSARRVGLARSRRARGRRGCRSWSSRSSAARTRLAARRPAPRARRVEARRRAPARPGSQRPSSAAPAARSPRRASVSRSRASPQPSGELVLDLVATARRAARTRPDASSRAGAIRASLHSRRGEGRAASARAVRRAAARLPARDAADPALRGEGRGALPRRRAARASCTSRSARRRSRSASARRSRRATSSPRRTARTATRSRRARTPNEVMAELYGKLEGCSHGYGGSMHLYDVERGNLGANAVVGGGLPAIVGAALAFKFRSEPRVAVAFFGDGATNIGTFHESLNLAQLWQVPARLRLREQPLGRVDAGAASTRRSRTCPSARSPSGCTSIKVDGQDVEAVYDARAAGARARARRQGPGLPRRRDVPPARPLHRRPAGLPLEGGDRRGPRDAGPDRAAAREARALRRGVRAARRARCRRSSRHRSSSRRTAPTRSPKTP